jgi:hypothetical protein
VDDLAAFEVLRQRRAAVVVAALARLVISLRLTALRAAFAAAAEAVLQRTVELAFPLGVLGAQPRQFAAQLADHRLQAGDVVGQRRVGGQGSGVHARVNPAPAGGLLGRLRRGGSA